MTDLVNHPSHYTSDPSGVECITITRHRNFNIGSAMKYLWRAGLKEPEGVAGVQMHGAMTLAQQKQIQDLNKAIWYIVDEIHRLGGRVEVAITVPPSEGRP